MLRAVLVSVIALFLSAAMPMVLLQGQTDAQTEDRLLIIKMERQEANEIDEIPEIRLKTGENILTMPLETYLTGVVLAEMPISFHEEALKAQAVAARTFSVRRMQNNKHEGFDLCDQSDCCQAWSDQSWLQKKLGAEWEQYWEKASRAVEATKGQVLTYNGEWIDAVYFSCSGGSTETAAAVWGSDVPYLQTVESPGEETASKYRSEKEVSVAEFRKLLPEASLPDNPAGWFGAVTHTAGGGVETMEIGGESYTGTELRSRFGLNSTKFTVAIEEGTIVFEVFGYGHRVGMSQYGANAMANQGKTYAEILQHYYPGTVLE